MKQTFSQTDFQQNKDWNWLNTVLQSDWKLLPDRFPTKQGLKLLFLIVCQIPTRTPRPISDKTRIETVHGFSHEIEISDSQTDFQQNKDWNFIKTLDSEELANSQTDFQQNKDWN